MTMWTDSEMWDLSAVVPGFRIYSVTTYLHKEMLWKGFLTLTNDTISLRKQSHLRAASVWKIVLACVVALCTLPLLEYAVDDKSSVNANAWGS